MFGGRNTYFFTNMIKSDSGPLHMKVARNLNSFHYYPSFQNGLVSQWSYTV